MSNLMYQCSAQVFAHNLKNLSALLKGVATDARARGFDPSVLLNYRLAPDMAPLTAQVQLATDQEDLSRKLEALYKGGELTPPTLKEVEAALKVPLTKLQPLLSVLVNQGSIIKRSSRK